MGKDNLSLRLSVPPDATILTGLSLELYIGTIPVAGSFKTAARFFIPFFFRLKLMYISNPIYIGITQLFMSN